VEKLALTLELDLGQCFLAGAIVQHAT